MGDDEWHRLWTNLETPPYEVLRVEAEYRWPKGLTRYKIYYRTYKKAVVNYVFTTDELGAFVAGTALMKKLRAASDNHREKYK
jgi:hypothetical protein